MGSGFTSNGIRDQQEQELAFRNFDDHRKILEAFKNRSQGLFAFTNEHNGSHGNTVVIDKDDNDENRSQPSYYEDGEHVSNGNADSEFKKYINNCFSNAYKSYMDDAHGKIYMAAAGGQNNSQSDCEEENFYENVDSSHSNKSKSVVDDGELKMKTPADLDDDGELSCGDEYERCSPEMMSQPSPKKSLDSD